MDDNTPKSRPHPPKAEPGPTEAELSRMAREAVHQPPDSRIDKQLAWMGLTDSEPAEAQPRQTTDRSAVADPEIDLLRTELRRAKMLLWALVAVAAILAIVVVVLLVR